MNKRRCVSKKNFPSQTHPSKRVQKNVQKAWNFTKKQTPPRCFDKDLKDISRTNANGTGEILLIVVLMVG